MSEPMSAEDAAREGLHRIWREAADSGMETGIDWPRVARDLFTHIDRLTEALEAAEKAHEACAETEDDAYTEAVNTLANTPIAAEARATQHWKARAERAESDLAVAEQEKATLHANLLGRKADLADEKRRHADEFERGVRQAIEWLRADYEYGTGPDWREQGAEWIAERAAERRVALLLDTATKEAP